MQKRLLSLSHISELPYSHGFFLFIRNTPMRQRTIVCPLIQNDG
ncbi:nucleoside triphosphatase NudI, partial [Escherichia coli]|nr:nucleoside triphosphatase NudI [Escherichia coli]